MALAAQGVGRPHPTRPTMRDLQATVDRLAQFQIDSINIVARAHYLPLFSRLGRTTPSSCTGRPNALPAGSSSTGGTRRA